MNNIDQSENLFPFFDHLPFGTCIIDINFTVKFWNNCLENWTGISRSQIINKSLLDQFPNLNSPKYSGRIENIFKGGPPLIFSSQIHKYFLPARSPSGLLRIQHTTIVSIYSIKQDQYDALILIEDVTELNTRIEKYKELRKKTLEEIKLKEETEILLQNEKNKLSMTLLSIGEAVITTDITGNILMMNKVAEELTGWNFEEAQNQKLEKIFQICSSNSVHNKIESIYRVMIDNQILSSHNIYQLKTKNNLQIDITFSAAPINDHSGTIIGLILVFRDVSENVKLLEELQKARTLESLGILAGGIAHDFNNLLLVLFGNISLAKQHAPKNSFIFNKLDQAEKAFEKGKDIASQLLTFSKGGSPRKTLCSIQEILNNVLHSIQIPENISIIKYFGINYDQIYLDKEQIKLVFNNIIVNSIEAMPNGGSLEISLENGLLPENIIVNQLIENISKSYQKIVFKDSGVGIEEENLIKIFNPFFTTKFVGRGIGLSTAYSIIKKHEGFIYVESKLNDGTSVTIYLP